MTKHHVVCLLGSLYQTALVVTGDKIWFCSLVLLGHRRFGKLTGPVWSRCRGFGFVCCEAGSSWIQLAAASPWVPEAPSLGRKTDASDTGWGFHGYLVHQCAGFWSYHIVKGNIKVGELGVVLVALQLVPFLQFMSF